MKITFSTLAAGSDGIEVDAIKLTGIPLPEGIADPDGENCNDDYDEEQALMFVKI